MRNGQRGRRTGTVRQAGAGEWNLVVLPGGPDTSVPSLVPDPDTLPGWAPATVAIIHGQPLLRALLELAIAQTYDFEVVFCGRSADDLGDSGVDADLVVFDLPTMAAGPALEAVYRLARDRRVLVTAPAANACLLMDAVCAGAHGCLTDFDDEYATLSALRAVARGGVYVCAELSGYLRDRLAAPEPCLRR